MCHSKELAIRDPRCRVHGRHDRASRGFQLRKLGECAIWMSSQGGYSAIGSIDCFVEAVQDTIGTIQHQPRWAAAAVGCVGEGRQLIGLGKVQRGDKASV